MLKLSTTPRSTPRRKQSGATLIITLVILVAMTLATISLMRSVDTTNIIAGNLAFQQAAAHAADAGTEEAALTLLPSLYNSLQLECVGNCPQGYISWHDPQQEPPVVSWETYWGNVEASAIDLPPDAFGNAVSYVVESMCETEGHIEPCVKAPPLAGDCGGFNLGLASQTCPPLYRNYYRVTTRVEGPRNTVSYVQTMLAM